jgi:hypothetical protein
MNIIKKMSPVYYTIVYWTCRWCLWEITPVCTSINIFYETEKHLFHSGIVSSSTTCLPSLEKLLLDLTSYGCTDSVFYCLTLRHWDHIEVRFHETGCFQDLTEDKYLLHMSATSGIYRSNFYWCNSTLQKISTKRQKIYKIIDSQLHQLATLVSVFSFNYSLLFCYQQIVKLIYTNLLSCL